MLANDAVELAVVGALPFDQLGGRDSPIDSSASRFPLRALNDQATPGSEPIGAARAQPGRDEGDQATISPELGREPTDCELETLAQTWSEHCSHKTLRGRIAFEGRTIDNLLKQTIFRATHELGCDWLVSVFSDNAGVVRFDDDHDVCFKVETHNHPSAIDPYGGAQHGTGRRDPRRAGDRAGGQADLQHRRLLRGVARSATGAACPPACFIPNACSKGIVAGVRDYGNRMGIPTVNGALAVDPGYLANPLVFCGTVGVLPRGKSEKRVEPGDRIVAIGGRTGRDGIHGATFSSAELTAESERSPAARSRSATRSPKRWCWT